jgi:hypothetical protein
MVCSPITDPKVGDGDRTAIGVSAGVTDGDSLRSGYTLGPRPKYTRRVARPERRAEVFSRSGVEPVAPSSVAYSLWP